MKDRSDATRRAQRTRHERYIRDWKDGRVDGTRGGTELSKRIRKYLFETRGMMCEECGWGKVNTFTGKVPVEIDHIDGNPLNNKESNLKILCPNCHSLTSTYKGANKGSGRAYRRLGLEA